MSPEFLTALPFILIGLVLLLLVVWFVSRSNRKTSVIDDESTGPTIGGDDGSGDGGSGDGGGGKPTRNQALIDAPKATEIVYGTTSANANADEIATAGETADSEAGVSVAPTVGDPVPPRPGQDAAPGEKAAPAPEADPDRGRAGSEPRPGETRIEEPAPHAEARSEERSRPSPPSTPKAKPSDGTPGGNAGGDDLTRIKGLGPKLATMLRDQGITRFEQIAGWSDDDIDRIDANLGRFKGRIRRDQWVEQATLLKSGDQAAFESRFGNTR